MPSCFAVTLHLGRIKTSLNGLIMVMLHYSLAWRKISAEVLLSSCTHNTHTAKPIMRIELFFVIHKQEKGYICIHKKITNVMSLHCLYKWSLKNCIVIAGLNNFWPMVKRVQWSSNQHIELTIQLLLFNCFFNIYFYVLYTFKCIISDCFLFTGKGSLLKLLMKELE